MLNDLTELFPMLGALLGIILIPATIIDAFRPKSVARAIVIMVVTLNTPLYFVLSISNNPLYQVEFPTGIPLMLLFRFSFLLYVFLFLFHLYGILRKSQNVSS